MDDVEIVIKISEKEYDAIKENKYGVFSGRIFQAIRDGRKLLDHLSDYPPNYQRMAVGLPPVIHHEKPMTKEDIDNYIRRSDSAWIPVTERLPELCGDYLVTVKDELREGLTHVMVCTYIPYNIVLRWARPDIHGPVIAWMPLPDKYKESEE